MTNNDKVLLHRKVLLLLERNFQGLHPEEKVNDWREIVDLTIDSNLALWERRCLAIALLRRCHLKPEHQEEVLERVYEMIENEVEDHGGELEVIQAGCDYVRDEDPQLYRGKLATIYQALKHGFDTGLFLDVLEDIGIPKPDAESVPETEANTTFSGASNESN